MKRFGLNRAFALALAFGVLSVAALGCVSQARVLKPGTEPEGKLQVTASFYPLYYFASVIGGDQAEVRNITPAGAEPHDYEPTSQDIAWIEKSALLILNGGLEGWGDKIRDELKDKKVTVVVASEGLFTQQATEEGRPVLDPHVWLSPPLAKRQVERILDGFRQVDPKHRSDWEQRAHDLENQLDQLDATYKAGLAHCQQSDIVTSHAAFGYLAQTYGLHQLAVAGLSPDAEPSAKDMADLAKLARAKHIKYIFFESLVSPRLSETLANEIGAKTLVLDPIEGLSDEQRRQGKNYFSLMDDNLKNLQTALECAS